MTSLSMADLKLILRDLLTKRHTAVHVSGSGQLYAPMLEAAKVKVDALPAALVSGKPLAVELRDTDSIHDNLGRAIRCLIEAYGYHPTVSVEAKQAAARVGEAFVPSRRELIDSYSEEASRAIDREPQLETLRLQLEALPVVGGTVSDWAGDFIATGKKLDELLSSRADITPEARAHAGALRSRTLGLISRFRNALADELAHRSDLPADLDKQVFGYLDELAG